MKRIFKYETNRNPIIAPIGKVVLVAQQRPDQLLPTIWIEHYEHAPVSSYEVYGTGHVIPEHLEHVGSCICGDFVWHVYRYYEEY